MKILIDMNLSPAWGEALSRLGWETRHWSAVGRANATDSEIMAWARRKGYVVFTHDLDFGALLAATQARGPSVIQVRTQDTLPEHLEKILARQLKRFESHLEAGALQQGRKILTRDLFHTAISSTWPFSPNLACSTSYR